jgi:hypothetical protein
MTSAPAFATTLPGRFAAIGFAFILAMGGAGLVATLSHPPGSAARAELTWAADAPVNARLDLAVQHLTEISGDVDRLASDAKNALATIAVGDATQLQAILDDGKTTIGTIGVAVTAVRLDLGSLPGGEPDAALRFSNATLVRRGAVFAALDATDDLATRWNAISQEVLSAAAITLTIREHDRLVAAAADQGRAAAYDQAIALLGEAESQIAYARELRSELFTSSDRNVLDDWMDLHQAHDDTLVALYRSLIASKGIVNGAVQTAYRIEKLARDALPNDAQAIVVIVADLAKNGLDQAVVAIDAARGQLDQAIQGVPGD